ncbi:protein-export chaperone SecB [Roseburia sp. CLA-AA-H204]|uniref:Protein-export chaperone SecB n=1 Tax=Roseburia amylophila TaxID=2981794 RepID=A0AAW4W843_9FIRM|nr:protein-export chaperone SecB [Roseburia amylophila]MCC2240966.1 protein-export chaperone SecB [Roseburia amylophila]
MDCVLKLNALVFDDITFKRLGMHSDNELEISFSVSIGTNIADQDIKKVSVKVLGEKREEYSFEIQASGFFSFEGNAEDSIIQQNAVAIVMPYIRSEVSLLTAQPGVEPVVIPPLNIAEMMSDNKR